MQVSSRASQASFSVKEKSVTEEYGHFFCCLHLQPWSQTRGQPSTMVRSSGQAAKPHCQENFSPLTPQASCERNQCAILTYIWPGFREQAQVLRGSDCESLRIKVHDSPFSSVSPKNGANGFSGRTHHRDEEMFSIGILG